MVLPAVAAASRFRHILASVMGIKFYCPSCDKRLNVKSFLAGKAGFCPHCHVKLQIPLESQPKHPKTVEAAVSGVLRQHEPAPGQPVAAVAPAATASHPGGNGHAKTYPQTAPAAPTPVTPTSQSSAAYGGVPQSGPAPVMPGGPIAAPGPYAAAPVQPTVPVTPQAAAMPQTAPYGGYSAPAVRPVVGAAAPAAPVVPAVVAPVAPVAPVMPGPAMVDPIAEAPHAVWYVRPPAGGQYGPAPGDVMRKWMGEGRVTADSLVWREGWPDWRKASKVFPSLGAAPAPVAAAPVAPLSGAPVTPAAPAPRRTIRAPRKRNNTALAITAIVSLVVLSIGLLIGLLWVLGVLG
jgi:hypothetical protein